MIVLRIVSSARGAGRIRTGKIAGTRYRTSQQLLQAVTFSISRGNGKRFRQVRTLLSYAPIRYAAESACVFPSIYPMDGPRNRMDSDFRAMQWSGSRESCAPRLSAGWDLPVHSGFFLGLSRITPRVRYNSRHKPGSQAPITSGSHAGSQGCGAALKLKAAKIVSSCGMKLMPE